MKKLNKRQKKHLFRILLTAALTAAAMAVVHFAETTWWQSLLLVLPIYLYIGYDVLLAALRDIGHGQVFGEKLLMSIATIGALAIGEYVEAVAVLLFFQVGELFESVANAEARKSLQVLASLCPDEATVLVDGRKVICPIDEIAVGATLSLHVGERLSLDSVIVSGEANLDFSSLTGESMPIFCRVGDRLPAGVVLLDSPLTVVTERSSEESATARILELMEDALTKKGTSERFITKFSFVYTPIVVLSALVVAFLLPLFADGAYTAVLPEYIRRALNFLVVSCPCALVISIPLSFFSASGRAAKQGIIFKSNAAIERLCAARVACFDKTGTVTSGKFSLVSIKSAPDCPYGEATLLSIAASLEHGTTHPLALAIVKAAASFAAVREQKEVRGQGVVGTVDGKTCRLGKYEFVREIASFDTLDTDESVLYLAEDGRYLAAFLLADTPKAESHRLVKALDTLSVKSVILSGDREGAVMPLARSLGVKAAHFGLLPEEKVEKIEGYKQEGTVVFVGDGINDAPSLAAADISFAMGALGSDAAIEAADAVICDDDPTKVPFAIALSRFTMALVRENLIFAIGIKVLILILSAFGFANLWLAIFADVGVLVLAILNAMRALRYQTPRYLKSEEESL